MNQITKEQLTKIVDMRKDCRHAQRLWNRQCSLMFFKTLESNTVKGVIISLSVFDEKRFFLIMVLIRLLIFIKI